MKALNSLAKLDRDNRQNKPHSKMEMRRKWRKQARVPWGDVLCHRHFLVRAIQSHGGRRKGMKKAAHFLQRVSANCSPERQDGRFRKALGWE